MSMLRETITVFPFSPSIKDQIKDESVKNMIFFFNLRSSATYINL